MDRAEILAALQAKAIEGWSSDVYLLTPEMAADAIEALLKQQDNSSRGLDDNLSGAGSTSLAGQQRSVSGAGGDG